MSRRRSHWLALAVLLSVASLLTGAVERQPAPTPTPVPAAVAEPQFNPGPAVHEWMMKIKQIPVPGWVPRVRCQRAEVAGTSKAAFDACTVTTSNDRDSWGWVHYGNSSERVGDEVYFLSVRLERNGDTIKNCMVNSWKGVRRSNPFNDVNPINEGGSCGLSTMGAGDDVYCAYATVLVPLDPPVVDEVDSVCVDKSSPWSY